MPEIMDAVRLTMNDQLAVEHENIEVTGEHIPRSVEERLFSVEPAGAELFCPFYPRHDHRLTLPYDYVRPEQPDFKRRCHRFYVEPGTSSELVRLACDESVPLFILFLAAYNIFLSRLSGQETIIIGSPVPRCTTGDFGNTGGLFNPPLVLRNRPLSRLVFTGFLRDVSMVYLDAYQNRRAYYDALVKDIGNDGETVYQALFGAMFVPGTEAPETANPGLNNNQNDNQNDNLSDNLSDNREFPGNSYSTCDITLYCEDKHPDGGMYFNIDYHTELFKAGTIRRFGDYFSHILDQIAANPRLKNGDIQVISDEEKKQVIETFNRSEAEFPSDRMVFQAFEDRVRKAPESTAVIKVCCHVPFDQLSLTYRELNRSANRMANKLRTMGVGQGTVVGIMLERSLKMVISLFAVLKAGGAYLPIEPTEPDHRVMAVLEQAGAAFLLTSKAVTNGKPGENERLAGYPGILRVEELEKKSRACRDTNPKPVTGPGDLTYIIFNPAEPGKPKGTGVYHQGFMNLMHWFNTEFGFSHDDRNLMMTSPALDLTQKNIYAPLMTGGTLCIPAFNYFEPGALVHEIRENWVTWINCTPRMFNQLAAFDMTGGGRGLMSLRYAFLGGEPVNVASFIEWLTADTCRAQVVNTYGPAQCTDISNAYRVRNPWRFLSEPVPAGKPVNNVKIFIPDQNMQPLPVGVPGELYIGGAGVGPGDNGDETLSTENDEHYITHSFGPDQPEIRLYRTGVLGKWLPDGELVVLGPIDQQI